MRTASGSSAVADEKLGDRLTARVPRERERSALEVAEIAPPDRVHRCSSIQQETNELDLAAKGGTVEEGDARLLLVGIHTGVQERFGEVHSSPGDLRVPKKREVVRTTLVDPPRIFLQQATNCFDPACRDRRRKRQGCTQIK